MKAPRFAARSAPAILPLAMLCVPKCPLCLLALWAALGVVLPPAPLLDGLVLLAAVGWLLLVVRVTPFFPARAAGVCGALLLLVGRFGGLPSVCWIGVIVMMAVVTWMRARSRTRAPSLACSQAAAARRT
jgi:hypothetical protein